MMTPILVLAGLALVAVVLLGRMAALERSGERTERGVTQQLHLLAETVEQRLAAIHDDHARQLEHMRSTVDDKLHGTLERRLGESFQLVSERLEQVHRGLGDMQRLATGVGDLKKVLTNVKVRGTWGEVQLATLLDQVMTPSQYACNVSPRADGERVEFAIRMPGRGDLDEPVWLPIDAKFPVEDHQRLIDAQDAANPIAAELAGDQLEARIKQCAKDISEKYLAPPRTTDFGILYLPTEGLFSEVVRRRGLCELVQQKYRVVLAGPTTLWSILTSLQMGFRTLAIEKRSSEVWQLLAAVKAEWTKYGEVLDRVKKQLQAVTNTVDLASTRTRQIGRKLRGVEELPEQEAEALLMLE
jgi:DNA recombination protein RmuC